MSPKARTEGRGRLEGADIHAHHVNSRAMTVGSPAKSRVKLCDDAAALRAFMLDYRSHLDIRRVPGNRP